MHVLYVHQNFPAQFGHIAGHLVQKLGWRCTFVSETPGGKVGGIEKIQYKTAGGATRQNHFCTRTFENNVWHCEAVYRALRARPDVKPDLIVGHSGFGSTLFLRELYPDVPIVNFFEYYYRPHDPNSDMDFRSDLGWQTDDLKYLRARARNAMILLDLQNCQLGYCPTRFQFDKMPGEYAHKLRVIFDGVDRRVYHEHGESLRRPIAQRGPRTLGGVDIPAGTRVVTYCSRGFESMRGFDKFMQAAKRICDARDDVIFLVAGTDRVAYGGDAAHTDGKSFKDWVLAKDNYDLNRIRFLGRVDPFELGRMMAGADLHIYLTVPFVLSWSMMDALSCGAVVLGSRTAPVQEMIRDGENGLLADFFDTDELVRKALQVLADPDAFRPLGDAGRRMIEEKYSLEVVMPQMIKLYEDARQTTAGLESPRPLAPAPTSRDDLSAVPRAVAMNPTLSVLPPPNLSKPASPPPPRSPFRG